MPRPSITRGRDASTTRSAAPTNRCSSATSAPSAKSIVRHSLSWLSRSLERRRAPSGAIVTIAPLHLHHPGPGSGEQRREQRSRPTASSGRPPRGRAVTGRGPPRWVSPAGCAVRSTEPGTAAARPNATAVSRTANAGSSWSRAAIAGQSSGSTDAPTSAGSDATSSGRGRLSTIHPVRVRTNRAAPPTDVLPRRVNPASAARSPSRAGPSTCTLVPHRAVATSRSAAAAAMADATTAAGPTEGAPSAGPVSAIAPDRAHIAMSVALTVTSRR